MDKAANGRGMGGVLNGPAYSRVALPYRKHGRCQVEGSLAALRPPVLAGAPAGLKPLKIVTRRGVLLLSSSTGSLADVGRNDRLRDEVVKGDSGGRKKKEEPNSI